jgi:hypothetical protein
MVRERRPGSRHEVGREQPHRARPPRLRENELRVKDADHAAALGAFRHVDGVLRPAISDRVGMVPKPIRNGIGAKSQYLADSKPAEEHV